MPASRERYFELLQSWRDLLALNYTTWPETREQPRSDTHAWSAHPTADLLRIVAGIRSGARRVCTGAHRTVARVLTSLEATAATPNGPVKVSYLISGDKLIAVIDRPAGLPGTFVWRGKAHALKGVHTRLELVVEGLATSQGVLATLAIGITGEVLHACRLDGSSRTWDRRRRTGAGG